MNEQDEPGLKRDPWIQTRPPGRRVHTSHQPNADKFCYHSSLTATSAGKHVIELFVSVLGDRLLKKLLTITKKQASSRDSEKSYQWKPTRHPRLTHRETSQTHIPCITDGDKTMALQTPHNDVIIIEVETSQRIHSLAPLWLIRIHVSHCYCKGQYKKLKFNICLKLDVLPSRQWWKMMPL